MYECLFYMYMYSITYAKKLSQPFLHFPLKFMLILESYKLIYVPVQAQTNFSYRNVNQYNRLATYISNKAFTLGMLCCI